MVVVGATVRLYHLGQQMIRTRMSYLAGEKEIPIVVRDELHRQVQVDNSISCGVARQWRHYTTTRRAPVEVQKCNIYLLSFERLFTGG